MTDVPDLTASDGSASDGSSSSYFSSDDEEETHVQTGPLCCRITMCKKHRKAERMKAERLIAKPFVFVPPPVSADAELMAAVRAERKALAKSAAEERAAAAEELRHPVGRCGSLRCAAPQKLVRLDEDHAVVKCSASCSISFHAPACFRGKLRPLAPCPTPDCGGVVTSCVTVLASGRKDVLFNVPKPPPPAIREAPLTPKPITPPPSYARRFTPTVVHVPSATIAVAVATPKPVVLVASTTPITPPPPPSYARRFTPAAVMRGVPSYARFAPGPKDAANAADAADAGGGGFTNVQVVRWSNALVDLLWLPPTHLHTPASVHAGRTALLVLDDRQQLHGVFCAKTSGVHAMSSHSDVLFQRVDPSCLSPAPRFLSRANIERVLNGSPLRLTGVGASNLLHAFAVKRVSEPYLYEEDTGASLSDLLPHLHLAPQKNLVPLSTLSYLRCNVCDESNADFCFVCGEHGACMSCGGAVQPCPCGLGCDKIRMYV